MGVHSPGWRKFVLMAQKSLEIPKSARSVSGRGCSCAKPGALFAADSLACAAEAEIHANFGRGPTASDFPMRAAPGRPWWLAGPDRPRWSVLSPKRAREPGAPVRAMLPGITAEAQRTRRQKSDGSFPTPGTSLRTPRLCGETIMTTDPLGTKREREGGRSALWCRECRDLEITAEAQRARRRKCMRELTANIIGAATEARRLDSRSSHELQRPRSEKRHQTRRSLLQVRLCVLRASAVKQS